MRGKGYGGKGSGSGSEGKSMLPKGAVKNVQNRRPFKEAKGEPKSK